MIQEHSSSDVAAPELWVRVGSRDETVADEGLAHDLEHMVFKGTANRPAGFIDSEVEGVGVADVSRVARRCLERATTVVVRAHP